MSDYFAKSVFGEDAIYGVMRIAFTELEPVDGLKRYMFSGVIVPKPSPEEDIKTWQIMDASVYIKPIKREEFRGVKGLTLGQVAQDFHFQNAFGECVNEDNPDCCSCEERGYKINGKDKQKLEKRSKSISQTSKKRKIK
jgi:hypothetical protein